jgi:hypothetical protein
LKQIIFLKQRKSHLTIKKKKKKNHILTKKKKTKPTLVAAHRENGKPNLELTLKSEPAQAW